MITGGCSINCYRIAYMMFEMPSDKETIWNLPWKERVAYAPYTFVRLGRGQARVIIIETNHILEGIVMILRVELIMSSIEVIRIGEVC
jgi:hypothetical protein